MDWLLEYVQPMWFVNGFLCGALAVVYCKMLKYRLIGRALCEVLWRAEKRVYFSPYDRAVMIVATKEL